MGTILGTLGDLGYGHAFRVLDAQWFGVAQRRERVVIVGCSGDWTGPAAVLLEPTTGGGHPPTIDEKEARAALRAGRRPRKGRRGAAAGVLADDGIVSALTSSDGGIDLNGAQAGHYVPEVVPPLLAGTDGAGVRTTDVDTQAFVVDVSPTVTAKWRKGTGGPSGDECQNMIVEAVPIAERGRDGVTALEVGEEGAPYTVCTNPQAQAIAYSVVPEFGQGGDLVLTETEVAGTLTVNNLGPKSGDRQPLLLDSVELVVRRLLPVECLRLQGFPDDWCGAHDAEWNRPDGLSDSAVYAAAGNAVAVPVFSWVGLRLVKAHEALIPAGWRHAPQDFTMPEVLAEPDDDDPADAEPLALF